jgi:glycosyltransferase involved in cell wall biosynthesis
MSRTALRIAQVQPMTLDLFGHRDEEFGNSANYFLPNLARGLRGLGHEPTVHLLTSGRAKALVLDGIEVRFHRCIQPPAQAGLEKRFGRQLSLSMLRALGEQELDVVHFHGALNSQLMLAAAAFVATRRGLPFVAQDQGRRQVRLVERIAARYATKRVSAFLAASDESVALLQTETGSTDSIHLMPNGFDPRVFYPAREGAPSGVRDPLRILFVSRLTREKDPLTMARGVARFATETPVSLTVVGLGPLRRDVARILEGTPALVRFEDHMPQREVAKRYRAADVLVQTSPHEGWSQTVLEAMACGLPVIATDVPGTRDVLGGTGLTIRVGDEKALAAALRRFVADSALRDDLRQRALQRAQQFTWERVARRLEGIYEDVLARRDLHAGV